MNNSPLRRRQPSLSLFHRRLIAFFIDISLCSLPVTLILVAVSDFLDPFGETFSILANVIGSLGIVLFILKDIRGQSLGKQMMKIRIVPKSGSEPIKKWKLIVRNLTSGLWPAEAIIAMSSGGHDRLSDGWLGLMVTEDK